MIKEDVIATDSDNINRLYDKLIEQSEKYTTSLTSEHKIIVQKLVSKNPKRFCDWFRVVIVQDFRVTFLPFYLNDVADVDTEKENSGSVDKLAVIDNDEKNACLVDQEVKTADFSVAKDISSVPYKLLYLENECVLEAEPGLQDQQSNWLKSTLLTTACKWLQVNSKVL